MQVRQVGQEQGRDPLGGELDQHGGQVLLVVGQQLGDRPLLESSLRVSFGGNLGTEL